MLDKAIHVTFNGLSGFARRTISHTCSCLPELPTTYETYPNFVSEFDKVLHSDCSWAMEAI